MVLIAMVGNCEEELPKKPFGRLSVDCWPTGYQPATESKPTDYELPGW